MPSRRSAWSRTTWLAATGEPIPARTSILTLLSSARAASEPGSIAKVRNPTRPPKKENSLVAPSTLTGTRFGWAPIRSQNSDSRGTSGS